MKLKNLFLFGVAALLLCSSSVATAGQKHKQKCIKWDPLIGAYTGVFTQVFGQDDVQTYGSFVFNAGGTWTGQITLDLGQPVPGGDPCGNYTTVGIGTWKKIGCRTYKFFLTNVSVARISLEGAPECCCPATPIWRQKGEWTATLSEDGKSFSSNDFLISFWEVDDLSVDSANILKPTPVGPFIGQRVGD